MKVNMSRTWIVIGVVSLLMLSLVGLLVFKSRQNKRASQQLQANPLVSKEIPQIEEVPFYFRALDYLLRPAMWVIDEFKMPLMETHPWHPQNIHCDLIPNDISEKIVGQDPSRFSFDTLGLIHMPLLGGWKHYLVLEAEDFDQFWHVGWKITYLDPEKGRFCQVHKLKIYDRQIKVLSGINDSEKIGFGLNDSHQLIPLKIVGEGVLGDGQFEGVRLF